MGDIDKALFYAEIASYLDGQSKIAQSELQTVSNAHLQQIEQRSLGLSAQAEKAASLEQQEDVEELLQALSLRDHDKIAEQAAHLEKKYAGKPVGESARDASSVALEMQGRHEEAKKIVERLASSAKTPGVQKRAAALLQSPEYNLLATLHEARSERRAESVKYVLLGEDLLKKNLIYAAGAVAAAGPAGAVTLGAANAMLLGNNLINVLSQNPVSAQSVIDAGVAYVRNHPGSVNASEVYKILADTYEEKGMIDKAIGYHELAGTPKEKLSSLKQKAATALLNAAAKSKGRGTQEYYLTTVIDQYPESPAAAEATKKLAELAKTDSHGLRMSKQFLKENPELFGPAGLGLKASLFDGNPRNMELADRGVNVTGKKITRWPWPMPASGPKAASAASRICRCRSSKARARTRASPSKNATTQPFLSCARQVPMLPHFRRFWIMKCSAKMNVTPAASFPCRRFKEVFRPTGSA